MTLTVWRRVTYYCVVQDLIATMFPVTGCIQGVINKWRYINIVTTITCLWVPYVINIRCIVKYINPIIIYEAIYKKHITCTVIYVTVSYLSILYIMLSADKKRYYHYHMNGVRIMVYVSEITFPKTYLTVSLSYPNALDKFILVKLRSCHGKS